MASNIDVLNESTRVAQEAAKVAGLNFTPGAEVVGGQIKPVTVPASLVNTSQNDLRFPTPTGNSDLASALAATKAMSSASTSQRETDLTKERDAYTSQLKTLLGRQEQKPLDVQSALEQAGVNKVTKELQDLSGQIATKTASLEAGLTNIEGKAIPMELLTGEQAQLRRQGLAEIGTLQARQQVLLGNLAAAKDAAQRAVDLIYAPEEQRIQNIQTFLQLNEKELTKEEKKKADLLTEALRVQSEELSNKKTIQSFALNAAANYPDAGISPTDDVATVNKKVLTSPTYRNEQAKAFGTGGGASGGITGVSTGYVSADGQLTPGAEIRMAQDANEISTVDSLKTHAGLNNAVGTGLRWFSRFGTPFTGSKQDFIAEVERITSNLTLESLINAKSRGATFGALSEGEMRILSSAATKIGSWRQEKDGKVVGYKASEDSFKKELDKISNFAKLDFILKGGNPADVGVTVTPDGGYWATNSDGSFTKLR